MGGVVIDLADLPAIEASWEEARWAAGIDTGKPIKYSMKWPGGPEQRSHLITAIGELPLQALVSLLEDFRPLGMKARKATRKDAYIHRKAFEWALQRLAGELFRPRRVVRTW